MSRTVFLGEFGNSGRGSITFPERVAFFWSHHFLASGARLRCRFTVYSRLTRCKGVLSRRGVFEADPMISKNESSDLWPEFFSGTRDPARPARSGPGRSGQVRPGQPESNRAARSQRRPAGGRPRSAPLFEYSNLMAPFGRFKKRAI